MANRLTAAKSFPSTSLKRRIPVTFAVGAAMVTQLLVQRVPASGQALSYSLTKVTEADSPVQVLAHPKTQTVFVVEKTGQLRPLIDGTLGAPVLTITDITTGGEQGLLGAAFSPDGGWLYTNHTNDNGDTRISAFPFVDGRAQSDKRKELLAVEQPYPNHNGGGLDVTADGVLWIALGDGGSSGDPKGYGQNRDALLGKILRVTPTPTAAKPYAIPPGNINQNSGRPEIWALGLRNPWRFDVDEVSKKVWIADVGQNKREEVNVVAQNTVGANFGWKLREGFIPFQSGRKTKAMTDPLLDYGRDSGCSITGGVVYRGKELPELVGRFLFTDYCKGTLFSVSDRSSKKTSLKVSAQSISSFGTDGSGEVYVTSLDGPVYRLSRK
jgi:glucose/arabinose dehydrogenase